MNAGKAPARRMALRRLIERRAVESQEQLVGLLERAGYTVTQTTVSRDLQALGAEKVRGRGRGGAERYVLPGNGSGGSAGELPRMMQEFVVDIASSANLVVLKTPPGAAGPVASALDGEPPHGVLATVAGDDTVLVVTRSPRGGETVARRLARLMEAGR